MRDAVLQAVAFAVIGSQNGTDDDPDNETSPGAELVEEIGFSVPERIPDFAVDLLFALVVLVIGWYLSKLVVRLAGRTVARRVGRPSVTRTILRGVRITILSITVLVAVSILAGLGGFELLIPVTVVSAVVGIVLAPLVGSLINGLFILADRPYEIGDMIEITDEGHRGFVEDITIRYTKIFTLENTFIVIPNSEVHARDVINYSAEDERTRVSVDFEITYESDLETARRLAARAARSVDTVISGGPDIRIGSARYGAAPVCDIVEYGENGVLLRLRFWVKHPYKLALARSAVQAEIRARFETDAVEFAYPHTHHVFDETSGTARMSVADGRASTLDSERDTGE